MLWWQLEQQSIKMAETLFSLSEQIRRCTACPLWKKRTLAVSGEGSKSAKIMFVGDAPSEEEDRMGQSFVGKSGKLLDEMLKLSGLKRKNVFITKVVKCHPPNDRKPLVKELKTCRKLWLDKQIELIKPTLVVILGKTALKSLLNRTDIGKLHGKLIDKKFFVAIELDDAQNLKKILAQTKRQKAMPFKA